MLKSLVPNHLYICGTGMVMLGHPERVSGVCRKGWSAAAFHSSAFSFFVESLHHLTTFGAWYLYTSKAQPHHNLRIQFLLNLPVACATQEEKQPQHNP